MANHRDTAVRIWRVAVAEYGMLRSERDALVGAAKLVGAVPQAADVLSAVDQLRIAKTGSPSPSRSRVASCVEACSSSPPPSKQLHREMAPTC
jgi:hypothetical protein